MDLQVDFGVRMVEGGDFLTRQGTRVDGNGLLVGGDDKAVVDVGLLFAQSESLAGTDIGVFLNGTGRDAPIVDYLVLVGEQSSLRSSDGFSPGQVEVTKVLSG